MSSYKAKVFQELVTNIARLKSGTTKNAYAYLKDKAKPFLDKKLAFKPVEPEDKKDWPSEKKLWEQCSNLIVSFIEGMESGDIDARECANLVKDLQSAERAHNDRLYKLHEKDGEDRIFVPGQDFDPADPGNFPNEKFKNRNYNGPREDKDPGEGAEQVFHKYAKFRSRMDVSTSKQFIAIRMPVAVLLKTPPADPKRVVEMQAKLRKTGLVDDMLFGYPIVKEQVLIGLHPNYLQKYRENWSKYKKETKNKRSGIDVKLDADWDTISTEFTTMLKERFGRNYVMLGNPHAHGSLVWIWMGESRDLQRLEMAMGSSAFHIQDWAPPFEADKFRRM